MPTIIDLTTLAPTEGFSVQGLVGWSLSDAGDINGDGIDDFIVGVQEGSLGGSLAGQAYVIFGKVGATRANIDLTTITAADGFIIQGDAAGDRAGFSVSSAGDVNGDGIDDLIVGAPTGDDGGTDAGEAYVIFGEAGATRANIDLTNLAAADGFIIQGDLAGDLAGFSVSSAGDINGDGIDDLIVGAPGGDNGGANVGGAYVIFGKAGATRADIDLTSIAAADGFIIQGDLSGNLAGFSVSSAGDINGDGIDDLIIGSDDNSGWDQAFVIFGKAGATRTNIDLITLYADPTDGFVLDDIDRSDKNGLSVSAAGDINGDGIDDLIVGTPGRYAIDAYAGQAYVIFGKLGATRGDISVSSGLLASDGFIIQGAELDYAGWSVSAAGDVDGDGFDDLIVGAPDASLGGFVAGQAYVIFGKVGATRGTVELDNLAPQQGFIIQGDDANDQAGRSVSSAGDINGDGFADMLVGAPFSYLGTAYVIFGRAALTAPDGLLNGTTGADILNGTVLEDLIQGLGGNDVIYTGAGNDALNGGTGADIMDGGSGDDVYQVDDAGDVLIDSGGIDTVYTSISYTLGAEFEDLTFLTGAVQGFGNSSNNVIRGNSAANQLFGMDGNDTIYGDRFDTVLDGGIGNDKLVISAAGSLLASLSGFEALELVGGFEVTINAPVFKAGFANNAVLSGTGNLTLKMLAATPTLLVQQLQAEAGSNVTMTIIGSSAVNIVKSAVGIATTYNGGELTDQVRGSNLADTMFGGDGNDKIYAAGGGDTLTGGAGNDQFRYVFAGDSGFGSNRDQITDFTISSDRLNFALIDADAVAASDQAFSFIGTAAFANTGIGQIRYDKSVADLLVQADVNGDGVADMEIVLQGLNGSTLTAADFIL